jgi:hypothetical protein
MSHPLSGSFKHHRHIKFPEGSLVCDQCGSRVASQHCAECADTLCTLCVATTHSKGRRRAHTLSLLPGMTTEDVFVVAARPRPVSRGEVDKGGGAGLGPDFASDGSEPTRGMEYGSSTYTGYLRRQDSNESDGHGGRESKWE